MKTMKLIQKVSSYLLFTISSFILMTSFNIKPSNSANQLTVEVGQKQGVYIIYPHQKPNFEYEYIKTIDAGDIIQNWRASTLVEKLLRVYGREVVDGDAIIFTEGDLWKADVVKFKNVKPKTVTVEAELREGKGSS